MSNILETFDNGLYNAFGNRNDLRETFDET